MHLDQAYLVLIGMVYIWFSNLLGLLSSGMHLGQFYLVLLALVCVWFSHYIGFLSSGMLLVQFYLFLLALVRLWFSPIQPCSTQICIWFNSIQADLQQPRFVILVIFQFAKLGFAFSDKSGLLNPCLYLITSSKSFSVVSVIDLANLFQQSLFFILIILFVKHFFFFFLLLLRLLQYWYGFGAIIFLGSFKTVLHNSSFLIPSVHIFINILYFIDLFDQTGAFSKQL